MPMSQQMRIWCIWLLLALPGLLWAQPAPEEQVLQQITLMVGQGRFEAAVARCEQTVQQYPESKYRDRIWYQQALAYQGLKQYAQGSKVLVTLRATFPNSLLAPDAAALLYTLYLAQQNAKDAGAVKQEILARWSRTDYVWQVVEAEYRALEPNDPKAAAAVLDDAITRDVLAPSGRIRAQVIRLQTLQKANPEAYLAEGMKVMAGMRNAYTAPELQEYATLAGGLYPALMQAKRFDEARALSAQVEEKLVRIGNPKGLVDADAIAYFQSLQQSDIARVTAEMKPLLTLVKWSSTPTDFDTPAAVARNAYKPFIVSERWDEAKNLHEQMQAAIGKVKRTDLLGKDNDAYYAARLGTLAGKDVAQYIADLTQLVEKARGVTPTDPTSTAEAIQTTVTQVRLSYDVLMKAKRFDEAKTLHEQVQQLLVPLRGMHEWALIDQEWYFSRLQPVNSSRYLEEVLPYLAKTAGDVITPRQASSMADLVRRTYAPLLVAGRANEAIALHTQLQDMLKKMELKPLAQQDQAEYDKVCPPAKP